VPRPVPRGFTNLSSRVIGSYFAPIPSSRSDRVAGAAFPAPRSKLRLPAGRQRQRASLRTTLFRAAQPVMKEDSEIGELLRRQVGNPDSFFGAAHPQEFRHNPRRFRRQGLPATGQGPNSSLRGVGPWQKPQLPGILLSTSTTADRTCAASSPRPATSLSGRSRRRRVLRKNAAVKQRCS